jgi:hypothetical protein
VVSVASAAAHWPVPPPSATGRRASVLCRIALEILADLGRAQRNQSIRNLGLVRKECGLWLERNGLAAADYAPG